MLGTEGQVNGPAARKLLEMVDLDGEFITPNTGAAFEEVAEIDSIDHLGLEGVFSARSVGRRKMNGNILRPHA